LGYNALSFDVELLVTFACSQYVGIAALAQRHLPEVRQRAEERRCSEAVVFLEELAQRSGNTDSGPKNGVMAWTYGGNYTRPTEFAEALRPFWDDLLRHPVAGGPLGHHRILVLYQLQDNEHVDALEIALDPPEQDFDKIEELAAWPLTVTEHQSLPIRWY